MPIDETILWLQSEATGRRFPTVQFSADTDMVTFGWISLTSISGHELVIAQMVPSEHAAGARAAEELVEHRLNAALGRNDLRAVPLVRAEQRGPSGHGLSFQEFRRVYQPPRLLYRDIFADGSVAECVAESSVADFQSGGGRLLRYEA